MVINGIKKLKNSTMFSNAKVLVAGTMLAQAISILSAPFLARIYSPEEFGVYAVFLSASSVFISVSMMRYELAIVLPKHKSVGRALAVFALCSCVVVSLLLFIVTILWGKHLQNIFGEVSETGIWTLEVEARGYGADLVVIDSYDDFMVKVTVEQQCTYYPTEDDVCAFD